MNKTKFLNIHDILPDGARPQDNVGVYEAGRSHVWFPAVTLNFKEL